MLLGRLVRWFLCFPAGSVVLLVAVTRAIAAVACLRSWQWRRIARWEQSRMILCCAILGGHVGHAGLGV